MTSISYALESCPNAYRITPRDNIYSESYCVGCRIKTAENPEVIRKNLTTIQGLCRGMTPYYTLIPNSKNTRMHFRINPKVIQNCPNRPKITLETAIETKNDIYK